MSAPRLPDYLGHMLAAAREAQGFVDGMSQETFLHDRRTQQAVVMSLLVVGEAAAKIMDASPDFVRAHPQLPWRSMRGMRNRMAHGYFEIDYQLVWETVDSEIPKLISELAALLYDKNPGRVAED